VFPQLIRFGALCRIQNLGVDLAREPFLLRKQLCQRRTLACGDVLHPALIRCAVLECERIHLLLLRSKLANEFRNVRPLAFPESLDLRLLCIAQVQFVGDVAHRSVIKADGTVTSAPRSCLCPCDGDADDNQRRA
jgi:hypothetical protein